MQMDIGLDTGAVFSRVTTPIKDTDTTHTLQERLAQMGAELLLRDIAAIASGTLAATSQPDDGVTYAKKITSAECAISWQSPAKHLSCQIRAFNPHPGSYTLWQGKRLKILKARESNLPDRSSAAPGTVLKASTEALVVQCGEGALDIEEVQLEGKKRMTTAEFMRGTALTPGTVLNAAP
jgi:methionyl-tRNA formyltransferase